MTRSILATAFLCCGVAACVSPDADNGVRALARGEAPQTDVRTMARGGPPRNGVVSAPDPNRPKPVTGSDASVSLGRVPDPGSLRAPSGTASRPAPSGSDATALNWDMPWQMAPSTERGARIHRDVTRTTFVKGLGRVKATPRVLASLGRPLRPSPGLNPTVDACRKQAEVTAVPFGPATVKAVSRGPAHALRGGGREGLVEMRITYRRRDHVEVRQSVLRCFIGANGRLLDAKALSRA